MSEPKVIELTESMKYIIREPSLAEISNALNSGQDVLIKAPPKLVHLSDLPDGAAIKVKHRGDRITSAYIFDGLLYKYISPWNVSEYEIEIEKIRDIKLIQGEFQVWQGGPCPWPEYIEVEVIYRFGKSMIIDDAQAHDWTHNEGRIDSDVEIIAHRCTGRLLDGAKLVP